MSLDNLPNRDGIVEDRYRVDNGEAFVETIYYSLTASQIKYQSFKTPTDKDVYVHAIMYTADNASLALYEGPPTGVVYNFTWTPKDRNRQTNNTPGVVLKDVTSLTAAGSFIDMNEVILAASSTRGTLEYLLKKNTEYMFRMKNDVATVNAYVLRLDWYEI